MGAALFWVSLAGCPRPPWPADTAVLLVESPPETLDRRLALSAIAEDVSGNLIEPGLVRIGDDGRVLPDLAESFERLDDATYLFTLRPGLRFHDGAPLTAPDVVATFESLRDPRLHSPLASKYQELRRVEALDDRRVRFTLERPYAPFLVDLVMGIVPARAQAAVGRDDFGQRPVGAGPFRFVSWSDEEHLLLEANPDYYGGRPALGHLLVKTVRDETTRALELLHGKADFAINAISPPLFATLERSPLLELLTVPGANAAYLMFQLDDPILADVRVRRAIARSIDRSLLVQTKFDGHAQVGSSLLPPGNWARVDDLSVPAYDPAGARQLLDSAGYRAVGNSPRFTLNYKTSTDRFRKSIALAIADELGQVGIAVKLQSLEFGTFFTDVRRGNFQLASLKWVPILEPDLLFWILHSHSFPTPENGYGGANRGRYRSPRVDALLEAARAETDEAIRRRDYAEVQRTLIEDLPYVVLWYEDSSAVVRRGTQGFHLSPFGFFSTLAQVRRAP